jgi:hypothetical protein
MQGDEFLGKQIGSWLLLSLAWIREGIFISSTLSV